MAREEDINLDDQILIFDSVDRQKSGEKSSTDDTFKFTDIN
jgi:hypothetical protein